MNIKVTSPLSSLPSEGFVRLDSFLGQGKALPISRSSWYALVRAGKAPKPIAMGPRTAVYSVHSIREFIASFATSESSGA